MPSRRVSTLRAMPRWAARSSNRRTPLNMPRSTSRVQASPISAAVRATEQVPLSKSVQADPGDELGDTDDMRVRVAVLLGCRQKPRAERTETLRSRLVGPRRGRRAGRGRPRGGGGARGPRGGWARGGGAPGGGGVTGGGPTPGPAATAAARKTTV